MSDYEQPGLFDVAHARRTDPETSHEAAASISADKIRLTQIAIYRLLRRLGPMHDQRIAEVYEGPAQSPSGLRTRRSELVGMGLVFDTGERVVLDSGRRSIVWQALL